MGWSAWLAFCWRRRSRPACRVMRCCRLWRKKCKSNYELIKATLCCGRFYGSKRSCEGVWAPQLEKWTCPEHFGRRAFPACLERRGKGFALCLLHQTMHPLDADAVMASQLAMVAAVKLREDRGIDGGAFLGGAFQLEKAVPAIDHAPGLAQFVASPLLDRVAVAANLVAKRMYVFHAEVDRLPGELVGQALGKIRAE